MKSIQMACMTTPENHGDPCGNCGFDVGEVLVVVGEGIDPFTFYKQNVGICPDCAIHLLLQEFGEGFCVRIRPV